MPFSLPIAFSFFKTPDYGSVSGIEKVWICLALIIIYSIVPMILLFAAKQRQVTDLGRRELKGWTLIALGGILVVLLTMNLGYLVRDLKIAKAGDAWSLAAVLWITAIYLSCHRVEMRNLFHDVFDLPNGLWVRCWRIAGYVGITLAALYPVTVVVTSGNPALSSLHAFLTHPNIPFNWPLAKVWRSDWHPAKITFLVLVVLYAACASYLARPQNLRRETDRFTNGNLLVLHALCAMLTYALSLIVEGALHVGIPLFLPTAIVFFFVTAFVYGRTKARLWPAREVVSQPWTGPSPDLLTAIKSKRSVGEQEVFTFLAAEGGGIHAVYRALAVLSELDYRTNNEFFNRIDMISSISGGSIGSGAYRLFRTANPGANPDDLLIRANSMGRSDLLLPPLIRLSFTDPWIPIFPTWRGLDRSKGLEEAVRLALEKSDNVSGKPRETPLPSVLLSQVSKTGPEHYFNSTSVNTGARFILGTSRLGDWPSNLTYGPGMTDLDVVTASCLSARFPIITDCGLIWLGKEKDRKERTEPWFERVVDGGAYDNSGIDVILHAIRNIRQSKPHAQFRVIVIGEQYPVIVSEQEATINAEKDAPDAPIHYEQLRRTAWYEDILAYPIMAIASFLNRNVDGTRSLADLAKADPTVKVFPISSVLEAINTPLGWYLDHSRANAIRYMLGCERYVDAKEVVRPFPEDAQGVIETLILRSVATGSQPLDPQDVKKYGLENVPAGTAETFLKLRKMRDQNKAVLASLL